MDAVILCGGLGTRMREETEFKPKPMVEIGGRPILWHIMKHYRTFDIDRFVLCLGYKGDVIRDYFINYHHRSHDLCHGTQQDAACGVRPSTPAVRNSAPGHVVQSGGLVHIPVLL